MSKSTPLNQLPTSPQQLQNQVPNPHFVNDHQHHIVTQAQNAVSTFAMPTNTQQQLGDEYMQDNDTTIQETLMLLKDSDMHPTISNQMQSNTVQHQRQQNPMPHQNQAPQSSGSTHSPPQVYAYPPSGHVYTHSPASDRWWSFMGEINDLKMVGLVMFVSIFVSLLPLEYIMITYVPVMLSSLPYSEIVTKAILAGLSFYITKALII